MRQKKDRDQERKSREEGVTEQKKKKKRENKRTALIEIISIFPSAQLSILKTLRNRHALLLS